MVFNLKLRNFLEFFTFLEAKSYKYKNTNDDKKPFSLYYLLPAAIFPVLLAKDKIDEDQTSDNELTITNKTRLKERFNFIADVVEQVAPAIVQIQLKQNTLFGAQTVGSGSGFIVSSEGHILTNAHVIQRITHEQIIKLNDGRTFLGRVLKLDKQADLALIKINSVKKKNLF